MDRTWQALASQGCVQTILRGVAMAWSMRCLEIDPEAMLDRSVGVRPWLPHLSEM